MDDLIEMKWGNTVATLQWFHHFNDKLYSNTTLIYLDYNIGGTGIPFERNRQAHAILSYSMNMRYSSLSK
jgi:hypothetical protein